VSLTTYDHATVFLGGVEVPCRLVSVEYPPDPNLTTEDIVIGPPQTHEVSYEFTWPAYRAKAFFRSLFPPRWLRRRRKRLAVAKARRERERQRRAGVWT
jgi:hypothetical protein